METNKGSNFQRFAGNICDFLLRAYIALIFFVVFEITCARQELTN
jgi:hypothetical protein